jgi:glycosyltransferase involved in cell wall biosynthesis
MPVKHPLRIVYLTSRDAKDKREWSGTLYAMARSLSKHSGEVIYVGPYQPKMALIILKVIRRMNQWFFKKKYNIFHSYLISLVYKFYYTPKINKIAPDVVFAAAASPEMSLLKVDCPIIFLGDITFKLLVNNYPNYTNLSKASIWESNIIEKRAFSNAAAVVVSSEWAANSAVVDYGVQKEKVHIVSFGANMELVPSKENVINKKLNGKLNLLFLGVDWIRKGGDIVYNTFVNLSRQGVNVELTVCGCNPPESRHPNMIVIPFLNKNNEADLNRLYQIMMDSHFLMVPSRSDCTPIVFCEANAFGMPVLTTDIGGITSVIRDGVNGHTFSLDAPFADYSQLILSYFNKSLDYASIVKSSREYYDSNLNWDKWGTSLNDIITELVYKS